jgi:hypothetical protein
VNLDSLRGKKKALGHIKIRFRANSGSFPMKSIHLFGVLLAASTLQAQILSQTTANPTSLPAPTPYTVVAQDANDRVWQWETYEPASDGSAVPHIHQYTELATGLNHLVNGQWVASSEEINVSPDGSSAEATNGQHQVFFPGNIYNGEIKLVTPDGQTLQSQPIGLNYYDGTNSVLIAVITNATGQILASGNQVTYTNAFDGLDADLLYTYTKAGFEQDIILEQQPPDPASLGLNPQTTRLQVLTEFFNPTQPGVTVTTVATDAGDLEDDNLNFGVMQMGHGKAFLLGSASPSVDVNKQWLTLNGRQFLVEEVPIVSIASEIDNLPPFVSQTGIGTKPVVSKNLILPPQRLTHSSPKATFLANATRPSSGFVLDYVTMTSQTNYTFQGDSTYYISGTVNLSGTNTFEGGAVFKYATNAQLSINNTNLNWLAALYRPVIFTAQDDNTVGETISGSTGNPTNYYGNPALSLSVAGFYLSNFRIAYARQAIFGSGGSINTTLYNCQFVNCLNGLTPDGYDYQLRNALFANVQTNFNNVWHGGATAENGTFAGSASMGTLSSGGGVTLSNCILANVTSLGTAGLVGGNHNGFYNSPAFGASQTTNTFYPFQVAGAGSYYLTNGCAFTNAGTYAIDTALLADLSNLTTHPPIVYSNITFTSNLVFSPQATRDTNSLPDLGYHYYPLDYVFGGCSVSNNVTFTMGTAAGWFELPGSGGPGYGISLVGQVIAAFNGILSAPCYWTRYDTVQEGGNGNWQDKGWLGGIKSYENNSWNITNAPQIVADFTYFAELAGDPNHFRDYYTPLIAIAKNSEFLSGDMGGYNNGCYFTNCFMDRAVASQDEGYAGDAYVMRNCTWHGGWVYFVPYNYPIPLSVRDCAFDGTTFTIQSYGTNSSTADYAYNAYTNGAAQFPIGGTNDVIVTNSYNWQTSWLGNYYLPPGSPLLNHGDVLASQVGLYHFTILTNQVPEGTNIVSIGYHYVAVDQYGNPLDSNGDGIPDYLEDANGNGVYDTGDLGDWQNLNLNVIITRPRNGSILP